jgi:hypothetical protein
MLSFKDMPPGIHMCLVYDSEEVRQDLVSDFIGSCLRKGNFVGYFADLSKENSILRHLKWRFPDLDDQTLRNFEICDSVTTCCPNGHFSKHDTLRILENAYNEKHNCCSGHVNFLGEMDWVLSLTDDSIKDLPDYEHKINKMMLNWRFSAICQYDSRKFDPDFLYDIINAHPYILMDGMIIGNPTYRTSEGTLEDR